MHTCIQELTGSLRFAFTILAAWRQGGAMRSVVVTAAACSGHGDNGPNRADRTQGILRLKELRRGLCRHGVQGLGAAILGEW
eukprot:167500-Pyramimonas_sp.AAC.1